MSIRTETPLEAARRMTIYNGFTAAEVAIMERLTPGLKLTFPRNSWNTPLRAQVQTAISLVTASHPVAPIKFNHTTLVLVEVGDTVDVVCEAYNARVRSGIDDKIKSGRTKPELLFKEHLQKLNAIEGSSKAVAEWLAGLEIFWNFVEFDKKTTGKIVADLEELGFKPSKAAPKVEAGRAEPEKVLKSVIGFSLHCLKNGRVPKAIHYWIKQCGAPKMA